MTIDVAIIGGGLAGCATAYYLAREGIDVCLFERADLSTRASGANAGSIHLQIPHETFVTEGEEWANYFGPTLPLMAESIALWSGLSAELGVDLEFAQPGGLLMAEDEQQMADIDRKMAVERAFGVPVDFVGRNALRTMAPYVSDTMIGGAFCPLEGKANPLVTTFAFARAARRHGAKISVGTPVSAIQVEDTGYRLDHDGGHVSARRVVNAAGVDAQNIAAMVGINLNIEAHPLQVTVTAPVAPIVEHLVYSAGEKLTLKQTRAGSLLIGGGWPSRLSDKDDLLSVDPESVHRNLGVAARVVPAVAGAQIVRTWPAIVNGTADWRPVLGDTPGLSGFYTAFFPWMGFTAGPIVGRITADLILGRRGIDEIAPFLACRDDAN